MRNLISLLVIVSLLIPLVYADGDHAGGHMNMGSAAVWIPVIAGVAFISYLVFRPKKRDKNEAIEILNKSYASGEIDREEYLRRKKDLKN